MEWIQPEQDGFSLETRHMMLRAAIVYIVAVVIVRVGSKRFMGKNTAFDLLLGIMLGSVLSRAITGQSPFFPTLAAGAVLMVMHYVFAWLSYQFDWFSPLVKGRPRLLVKDGEIQRDGMRKSLVGEHDLMEALRTGASGTRIEDVALAHLERNGNISVILKKEPPQVLEVKAADGVQAVRITVE